ncbi:MAG TPA: fluoride efflux transporter CrcB [Burkholderiaceae bacterium]|nr:fluoride efflux transporter CrcB [Burkholderiaceae bacterium]
MSRDESLGFALFAIAVGAVLGAWLRWGLSTWLNPRVPTLPLGTLAANLIGGYLIGIAAAVLVAAPGLAPAWRLFFVTGFLGALTTFSTFSAESAVLLQSAQWAAALMHIGLHLVGSIAATLAGIATVRLAFGG